MKHYDWRFLAAGLALSALIFLVSLGLFPEWQGESRTLVVLAAIAIPAAFGFLANFRQAVEKRPPEAQPEREIHTGGGAYIEKPKIEHGDFVAGNQNQLEVNGPITGGVVTVGNGTTVNVNPLPPTPKKEPSLTEQRNVYFGKLMDSCLNIPLAMIDDLAVHQLKACLELNRIYTVLYTKSREKTKEKRGEAMDRNARFLSALELINSEKHLVIMGEPGSGKSTLIRFTAMCLAGKALNHPEINLSLLQENPLIQEAQENKDLELQKDEQPVNQEWNLGFRLPVLVVLRDLATRTLPTNGSVADASHLWKYVASDLPEDTRPFLDEIKKSFEDPGGLLLLDGLDELPRPETTRIQVQQVVADIKRRYPKTRIVVTTRTYAYQKPDWKLSDFAETELAPFNRLQIHYFIDQWYQYQSALQKSELEIQDPISQAKALQQAIFQRHTKLQDLAKNPLLLTVIAILHAVDRGQLPEQRAELYGRVVNLLLNRWDKKSAVGPNEVQEGPASLLTWLKLGDNERKKALDALCRLAYEVHHDQPDNTSAAADITFAQLCTAFQDISSTGLEGNTFRGLLADYLSQRAGILIERSAGIFSFPHRTFQEYLAALHLSNQKSFPKNINSLVRQDPNRWREVALLAGVSAYLGHTPAIWTFSTHLCKPADSQARSIEDNWAALMGGQALVESQDWSNPDYQDELGEVRQALLQAMQGQLPPRERAQAGTNLAVLGDPRFDSRLWSLPVHETLGFLRIPAGKFLMGSNPKVDEQTSSDEQPQHEVELPEYWLGMLPVTVAQYRAFVQESGFETGDPDSLRGPDNHPVVWVSWNEALAYCEWLGKQLITASAGRLAQAHTEETRRFWQGLADGSLKISLPSEAEWEKGARGGLPEKRIYPYKGAFDADKGNTAETGIGGASPVGCFPGGAGPYGNLDLSGNVWEWTRSTFKEYPYDCKDGREELNDQKNSRVLRGGSWGSNVRSARCSYRYRDFPVNRFDGRGFRVVALPSSSL